MELTMLTNAWKNIKEYLKYINPIHILFLFLCLELACYFSKSPVNHFSIIPFVGSSILTFIVIWAFSTLVSFCNTTIRRILSIIIGLIFSCVILTSLVVYSEFGEFVTGSKFQFFTNNLAYTLAFAKTYLFSYLALILISVWGAISYLFYESTTNKKNKRKTFLKCIKNIDVGICSNRQA